ncbi:MAG TPA: C45 family peptidase [Planctomycetota bacterium]|nr:C45 family peptidase [Planctomycetota bacterium]
MRRTLTTLAFLVLLAPLVQASELRKQDGVSILILNGTPAERGRAHGKLLAKEIVDGVGEIERLRRKAVPEEKTYLALLEKFTWSDSESAELDGILQGIKDALGQDVKVPGTDRPFARRDLVGVNVIADLLPLACSSFTVSGERVEGGATITARNLDYPVFQSALAQRLVIVRAKGEQGERGWASVAWPGTIGAFTGMNEAGVTASIHDVPTDPSALLGKGFVPRTVGVRRVLEQTAAEGYAEKAAAVLRDCPVIYGNNIHVSAPRNAVPAVILEWGPDRKQDGGVTVREAKDKAVVCTNHWRTRKPPEECRRFDALTKALAERKSPWTAKAALDALQVSAVTGERDLTLHSAVFSLEARKLLVAFAKDADHPAPRERAAEIDLGRLIDGAKKKWY